MALVQSPPIGIQEQRKDELQDVHNGILNQTALSFSDFSSPRLISSPYSNLENQLNIESLDTPNRLLAFALTSLTPVREDYATADYKLSFNWSTVFSLLRLLCLHANYKWESRDFYLVIFRSQLKEGADSNRLGDLDQKSHEEACASGGLLKYWFGSGNSERRNLATCIWRSRADATAGGSGPWHAQARRAASIMYEGISFQTHKLTIGDGALDWSLEEIMGKTYNFR